MNGALDLWLNEALDLWLGKSPGARVLLTREGRVDALNSTAVSLFGLAEVEVQGKLFAELLVPEESRAEHIRWLSALQGPGETAYEAVRQRPDTTLLYVSGTARIVPAIADADACNIALDEHDVTLTRLRRDAELAKSRFRNVLESTPDGILLVHPTGSIAFANSEAERQFGYATAELEGLAIEALLPQRYRRAHVAHRSRFSQQPRNRPMGSGLELSGLRKDGSEFPVEISLSPLRMPECVFVMGAIRDVSERKRLERELRDSNLELAEANQAKDRFLAGMSHELRTPLNAILGFTGTLLMKLPGPLNAEQEKQLRTVQSGARHLLAVINDLLDVAKVVAGKVDLRPEAVDCAALAEEIAHTLRAQAHNKGLQIDAHAHGPLVPALTDRRAVTQILLNLVGNAVKFTQQGGVRMDVSQVGDAGARQTVVAVSDTGDGIAAEDIPQLFGAFNRLHRRGAGETEGSGLGLHLSRKLALMLGGDIDVRSVPGEGSCFTLRLPEKT